MKFIIVLMSIALKFFIGWLAYQVSLLIGAPEWATIVMVAGTSVSTNITYKEF